MNQYIALWPVNDPGLKLPGLILAAEDELHRMLDEQDVILTGEPQWALRGDRLVCVAPARRRAPWDDPDPVEAYLIDMMPDPA